MAYQSKYDKELEYIVRVIAVILGKERFGKFAEFIDGGGSEEFAELIAKKDSVVNRQNYIDICYAKKSDPCPICGEDRNHPSQHGNHTC